MEYEGSPVNIIEAMGRNNMKNTLLVLTASLTLFACQEKPVFLDIKPGDCVSEVKYDGLSERWRPVTQITEIGTELMVVENLSGTQLVSVEYIPSNLYVNSWRKVQCPS